MRESAIRYLSLKGESILVFLIVLVGASLRLTQYGDLRLSVATLDTESYMRASEAPLLSWRAFTGERLFTTNLLYKIAKAGNCPIEALSIPAIGKESKRKLQACFEGLVLIQTALSVLGWSLLAWSFSTSLNTSLLRLAAAIVVGAFAFAPQIADWDSILSSESLTFSLFAMALGLLILALRRDRESTPIRTPSKPSQAFALAAGTTFALWALVRDSNVLTVLLLCLTGVPPAILLKPLRKSLISAGLVLFAVCVVGLLASLQSRRSEVPLSGAFEAYILPDPTRIAFMQRLGMPAPDSAGYQEWFPQHAGLSYAVFMGFHPRFVVGTVFENLDSLFANNDQPYFKAADVPWRETALILGNMLHARSTSILLVDLLIFLALVVVSVRLRTSGLETWTWSMGWLLASAGITLVLTFFADAGGVERHVVFALMLFRLVLWLGLLRILDRLP